MDDATNFNVPRRTSEYDPNRDSYVDTDGSYVYTTRVQENGRWIRKVLHRITPDTEENIELILMLDREDHAEDLQHRYEGELLDYGFLNQLNSKAGNDDDMSDTDAWAAIADRASNIEDILFQDDEDEEPQSVQLHAFMELLTESQRGLIYDHYGLEMQLTEICDAENAANGTNKSPQSVGNRKRKILNRLRKLFEEAVE